MMESYEDWINGTKQRSNPFPLWGKKSGATVHLLEYHLIDTASVCGSFLRYDQRVLRILSPDANTDGKVIDLLVFLCSIHDIGKIIRTFQEQSEVIGGYRHDIGGYILLCDDPCFSILLNALGIMEPDRRTSRSVRNLIRAATMHHGSPKGCDDELIQERYSLLLPEDIGAVSSIMIEMSRLYPVDRDFVKRLLESSDLPRLTNIIAGIINHCDWIASGRFDYCSGGPSLAEYRI